MDGWWRSKGRGSAIRCGREWLGHTNQTGHSLTEPHQALPNDLAHPIGDLVCWARLLRVIPHQHFGIEKERFLWLIHVHS